MEVDAAGAQVTRAFTNMDEISRDMAHWLKLLRSSLNPEAGTELDAAMASVESFADVALRVMSKTNPSKIRSVARTAEIKARMDAVPVVRGGA